jgi:putative ATPase
MNTPLAERMRPKIMAEYVGQEHLVGPVGALTPQLQSGLIASMILWGPPGTGKTTLAQLIAEEVKQPFFSLSAVDSGVSAIRDVIKRAKNDSGLFPNSSPLLFIDEIHRFSKSQQDSLLAAVEKGWITLIGATTENPSFEVIPALLSRCQVYTLNALTKENLEFLLHQAIAKDSLLKRKTINLKETNTLLRISGGDARKLLNTLELLVTQQQLDDISITDQYVLDHINQLGIRYDKGGDQHYDVASAMIKAIRGSDPNAAVYWLARMLSGGEDVKFISRRLLIAASEDIGLANPTALVMAQSTADALMFVGMPEGRIILSQCVIYLACSPKSNSAYKAINRALDVVKTQGDLQVPLNLRNAPTVLMKELGYGQDYVNDHNTPSGFAQQEFLPKEIKGSIFYQPEDNSKEQFTHERLKALWKDRYRY